MTNYDVFRRLVKIHNERPVTAGTAEARVLKFCTQVYRPYAKLLPAVCDEGHSTTQTYYSMIQQ